MDTNKLKGLFSHIFALYEQQMPHHSKLRICTGRRRQNTSYHGLSVSDYPGM